MEGQATKLRVNEFLRRSDGSPACHREGNQGRGRGELTERKQGATALQASVGEDTHVGWEREGKEDTARDISLQSRTTMSHPPG